MQNIKRKLSYFSLWLNDELADLLGTKPKRVKRFFDSIYKFIKICASFWPIVGAGWLALFLDEIKNSTLLFIHIAKTPYLHFNSYKLIWDGFLFDFFSITWVFLFIVTMFIEDHVSTKKFRKLRSAIIKAPNMSAYQTARSLLDKVYEIFDILKPHRNDYTTQTFAQVDELLVALNSVNDMLLSMAQIFFYSDTIVGANMMIFFKKDSMPQDKFENLLKQSTQIFFRCDEKDKLDGILYLPADLIMDIADPSRAIVPLIIPIYASYFETYKNPNDKKEEFILPGAMSAYRFGTSMVADARNTEMYYGQFDDRTKKEANVFFKRDGKGNNVRSFASFRIPDPLHSGNNAGVFNLDSHISYSFGADDEFFSTFYTMIYPALQLSSEYLEFYRAYIIKNL